MLMDAHSQVADGLAVLMGIRVFETLVGGSPSLPLRDFQLDDALGHHLLEGARTPAPRLVVGVVSIPLSPAVGTFPEAVQPVGVCFSGALLKCAIYALSHVAQVESGALLKVWTEEDLPGSRVAGCMVDVLSDEFAVLLIREGGDLVAVRVRHWSSG
jgi:hypothetical protein